MSDTENKSSTNKQSNNIPKTYKTIISGGFAGMISKTCTAPLERVQMLKQTGAMSDSIINILRQLFRTDGVRALWRGNLTNCVRVFPHKSVLFTSNEYFASLSMFDRLGNSRQFASGALSGFIATTITYPIDLVRAHLSGTLDQRTNSMFSIGYNLVRQRGFAALYTGWLVTIVGGIPYESLRIGCYGYLRCYLPLVHETQYGLEPHPIGKLLCGATAGAVAGIVTYPTDTLRRMLQVQSAAGMPTFETVPQCIISNYKSGGIRRFYRGLNAKLVRVVPDAAILFIVYETIKNWLLNIH